MSLLRKTLFSQHVRCNGVRNWMAAMNLYSKQVFLPAVIPRSLLGQVPEFWSIGWRLYSTMKKNKLQVPLITMIYSCFIDWMNEWMWSCHCWCQTRYKCSGLTRWVLLMVACSTVVNPSVLTIVKVQSPQFDWWWWWLSRWCRLFCSGQPVHECLPVVALWLTNQSVLLTNPLPSPCCLQGVR